MPFKFPSNYIIDDDLANDRNLLFEGQILNRDHFVKLKCDYLANGNRIGKHCCYNHMGIPLLAIDWHIYICFLSILKVKVICISTAKLSEIQAC